MKRTFPSVQLRLLVGIGGGIPSKKNDIRLGDVVVGMPDGIHGGVVQYDLGKQTIDGFERKGFLCPPPVEWRTAVVEMKSDHEAKSNRIDDFLSQMLKAYPKLQKYARPSQDLDLLFSSDCQHFQNEPTCHKCELTKVIPPRSAVGPEIFYGTIASGDSVIKNAEVRDQLSRAAGGALCFEMEAAGLSNGFPCVVIRGICDYADSHKNDAWHSYAAAAAAACAKELLTYMESAPVQLPVTEPTTYFCVPRQRVKHFFGREEEITRISSFFSSDADTPRNLVLCAMGGQGKSQIALEYCQRARDTYRGVFWINATSTSTTTRSLVSVAQELDSSAAAALQDDEAKIAFARRTLEKWKERWLLVFDNCDDPKTFSTVDRLIPQGVKGDILFSSRHRGLEELGTVIDVPQMSDTASVELLLHRYHNIDVTDHMAEGLNIVNRLGGLALAIDQASAYIAYKQIPVQQLAQFLPQYEKQRKKVLQHTSENFWRYTKINDEGGRDTATSAFVTWEMSFQQFLNDSGAPDSVAHFLTLTAFLGPTDISEDMFEAHWVLSKPPPPWYHIFATSPNSGSDSDSDAADESPPNSEQGNVADGGEMMQPSCDLLSADAKQKRSWDTDRFWYLVRQAYQMSLLQSASMKNEGGATFALHPLIRDWLQLRQHTKARRVFTYESIDLIVSVIRAFQSAVLVASQKQWLLLHMETVLSGTQVFLKDGQRLGQDVATCENAAWCALFYKMQGQYDRCLYLRRTVAETMTRELGREHTMTLKAMQELAGILDDQGKHIEAEELHREVMGVYQRTLGMEDSKTIGVMGNFAGCMHSLGKHEAAEAMTREVLRLKETFYGLNNPHALDTMNSLAIMLRARGDCIGAESLSRRTVESANDLLGPSHPRTMLYMKTLALALVSQGKLQMAGHTLRQAIEESQRILGEKHPDTLHGMCHLAELLNKQGRHEEAESMQRSILGVQRQLLGEHHPDTLQTLSLLAFALSNQGYIEVAEQIYRHVLALKEASLGEEHPSTLIVRNNLASVLGSERFKEAETMYRQTWKASERVLGKDHAFTLKCMSNLAVVLDSNEAQEELGRSLLEISARVLGKEHPDTMTSRNNLAVLLGKQGQYEEAENLFRNNVDLYQTSNGEQYHHTLSSMNSLAITMANRGKFEEAEEMFRKLVSLRQSLVGQEHRDTNIIMSGLKDVLFRQHKYEEAEMILRQILKFNKRVLGDEHDHTIQNMHELLRVQHKMEQATQISYEFRRIRDKMEGNPQIQRDELEVNPAEDNREDPDAT